MPLETELKLRVESHEALRARLKELGATPGARVVESNILFDRPDGSLSRRGCGLRVRAFTLLDGTRPPDTMTFKGPRLKSGVKCREEIEIQVDDAKTAASLLRGLGFVQVLHYEKRRESWTLGRCRIELDEPPHLGLFVEIEGPDEKTILAAQRQLGLSRAKTEQASYVRMLVAYCESHGITERVIPLP